MRDLLFHDADCAIGSGPGIGIHPGVQQLLADMDRSGVDRALVRHGNFKLLGAEAGNRELAEMLAGDDSGRLSGVWCILPDQCPELPQGEAFFSAMKKSRIRALTLYPEEHLFVPCRWSLGRIMDGAAERRIPVLFEAAHNDWSNIYAFVREFPRNRVIIREYWGKWGHDRQLRPLLENCENVFYSIGGYQVPEGIRDLVGLYGAERILYGSGYPRYTHGTGMLQLKQGGLTDEDVAKIAGRNLEKMLAEVQL